LNKEEKEKEGRKKIEVAISEKVSTNMWRDMVLHKNSLILFCVIATSEFHLLYLPLGHRGDWTDSRTFSCVMCVMCSHIVSRHRSGFLFL